MKESAVPTVPQLTEDEAARLAKMKSLDASGVFACLEGASFQLSANIRTQVLDAALGGSTRTVAESLTLVTDSGTRTLADEAAQVLEKLDPQARAGFSPPGAGFVTLTAATWDQAELIGAGEVRVGSLSVPYVDYSDRLDFPSPDAEIGERLGLEPGESELRQCVLLSTTAAILWARNGHPPGSAEVAAAARRARSELCAHAAHAMGSLGEAPPLVSRREADVRL